MLYRKKPITVAAYQWFPELAEMPGVRKLPAHAVNYSKKDEEGKEVGRGIIHEAPDRFFCDTLEGALEVSPGDWIITGVKGEHYPCKPDIFALSYEPAEMPPLLVAGEAGTWNEPKLFALLQRISTWARILRDPTVYRSRNILENAFDELNKIAEDVLLERQKEGPYAVQDL